MRRKRWAALAAVLATAMLPAAGVAAMAPGELALVSVAGDGTQTDDHSGAPAVSANGRFVAFVSDATNLVPGDTNNNADVFVKDRVTGAVERVSTSSSGAEGDNNAFFSEVDISADGRYVAFVSFASNLVAGDSPATPDAYLKDRQTGAIERLSVAPDGGASGSAFSVEISSDARYASFVANRGDLDPGNPRSTEVFNNQVYRYDRVTQTTTWVARTGQSIPTQLSDDGRYVAFMSQPAQNPGDPQNAVVMADLQQQTVEVLSVLPGGAKVQGSMGGLSRDARLAVFDNGGQVYLRDRVSGTTERVSLDVTPGPNVVEYGTHLSDDGRFVAWKHLTDVGLPGAEQSGSHIEVRDRQEGVTYRVTEKVAGAPGSVGNSDMQISDDGSTIVFVTPFNNLVPGDANELDPERCGPFTSNCDVSDVVSFSLAIAGPVDQTEPTATITTPADGAAYPLGAQVLADYACTDEADGSGIDSCVGDVADGSPIDTGSLGPKTFTVTATDVAGNSAQVTHSYTVVDLTAPAISITTPADGADYLLDQVVPADYSCTDEPGGSGIASCEGDVAVGDPIDTASIGPKTFTVTGTDAAGNQASASSDYRVVWPFTGFSDLLAPPGVNEIKAGKKVKLGFSLGGDRGLGILAPGYPVSQQITCDASAPVNGVEETDTSGQGLSFNPGTGLYEYKWDTAKAWEGSCRQLILQLADGTTHRVNFRFD